MHDAKRLDTAAAAALIGCSVSTVRKYIKEGRLAATKVGGKLYVDEEDLQSLVTRFSEAETLQEAASRLAAAAPPFSRDQVNTLRSILSKAPHRGVEIP